MVLLSWAALQLWQEMPGSAGGSTRGKAGSRGCSHCTGRMRREGPQGEEGSWAWCAGPTVNQGLLVARRAGAAAGTLECSPCIVPARGPQEPSLQGQ